MRQGDILLVKVSRLPKTATPEPGDRCVLAYGEATGHSHEVVKHGRIFVDLNDHGRRYLQVERDTALQHLQHGRSVEFPDHDDIPLEERMVHEIIRQREYRPKAVRVVTD
jgi:hypothetical protein